MKRLYIEKLCILCSAFRLFLSFLLSCKKVRFCFLYSAFRFSFCFLLSTFMLLGMISCTTPTANPKGSLTGTVHLEGQDDHSGITVALYDLAELDPDIVYANETWSHIGVIINQHTEFDHRFQTPIAVTQTEADGNFELTKIPIGIYNLVAIKDGWGFKYLYEVEIVKGENILAENTKDQSAKIKNFNNDRNQHFDPSSLVFDLRNRTSDLTLYPKEIISEYFEDQNNYFLTDHHYVIDDDTELLPNQYLEIQPGAFVRINPGVDFTIYGTLKAQGQENNMFWVTSNDCLNQQQVTSNQQLNEVELYNSMELSDLATIVDDLIEWGKWSWGNIAFVSYTSETSYDKLTFSNCSSGLYVSDANDITIESINSKFCRNEEYGGITAFNIENLEISANILLHNHNGIYSKFSPTSLIKNNFILGNSKGIWGLTLEGNIENNEFKNNTECDVKIASNTYIGLLKIQNNILKSNIGIVQYRVGSFYYYSQLIINNNNFYSENNFIIFDSSSFQSGDYIFAENNFYNSINKLDEILCKIMDVNHQLPLMIVVNNWLFNQIIGIGIL